MKNLNLHVEFTQEDGFWIAVIPEWQVSSYDRTKAGALQAVLEAASLLAEALMEKGIADEFFGIEKD